jgi:4-hydroxythreonine-4-phosphate dehydrogenase
LNPHAGEEGLLGPEEKAVLVPAAARAGILGPIAADTAWRWHVKGSLDGLVCLYHDQSLIALKALAGLSIVNWTAGLPFARTSPGHGTAFDLGRRDPDPSATAEAALLCARLAARAKK